MLTSEHDAESSPQNNSNRLQNSTEKDTHSSTSGVNLGLMLRRCHGSWCEMESSYEPDQGGLPEKLSESSSDSVDGVVVFKMQALSDLQERTGQA